ncbi:MAG: hypothetical protein PW844_07160 [Pantoea sp.]|uniref:hypothetical protein n=1 Tax=Pantoea sp. TaxID=69393 RepID=UPI0023967C56|nr:hypothetical protein [Pantoea sp.]MDE1186240.1 hypothetical protein [Pantoea sp.]
MSLPFARFFSLFETTRQIDAAVRAAAEFERARSSRDPASDDDRASAAVPL